VLGKPSWALAIAVLGGCSLITNSELGNGIGEACTDSTDCQAGECDAVTLTCTASCAAPEECPSGSACVDGMCRIATGPCMVAGDCAVGTTCENGVCVPAGDLTVGEPCTETAQCAVTLQCVDGLCTKNCSTKADCADPSDCYGGLCQLPLKVGAIWVGVLQDEGWTLTHGQGLDDAVEQLPYLSRDFVLETFETDEIIAAADKFIAEGAQVIVGNSFSQRDAMKAAAEAHPEQMFLTCSSRITAPNLGSYFARSYQAWYLAGYAAAQKSPTGRLGFVGSYVTPEVVRHINAFTRGAKKFNSDAVVEVRWEGFWYDFDQPVGGKYRETVLTEELLATGCDVIGHNSDVGRAVEAVQAHFDLTKEPVFSIGNDNIDACTKGPTTCIGTAYWNWGPMYVRMLDEIHRKVFDPTVIIDDNILVDPGKSIINFGMNDEVVDTNLKVTVGSLLANLADDPALAFRGPYCSTGQRDTNRDGTPDCVGNNETLTDDELHSMCWFVEGVVAKVDPDDPLSEDKDARVPDGTFEIEPGNKPDCRVNQ
jgi:basic membrane lipoprotein Med (substrate-binding protein (PBP1-ABC) superfamily)